MRNAIIIFLAVLAIPIHPARADGTADLVQRVVSLSERSAAIAPACESFLASLREGTRDSEKAEFYRSRRSALSVLQRADEYLGTPASTSEALEVFLTLPQIPADARAARLTEALARLSDCGSVEFYGFLTRLLDPRSQRLLTPAERLRARNLVVEYVRREIGGEAKPVLQTELIGALLTQGVRRGALEVSANGRAQLNDIDSRLRRFRVETASSTQDWEDQAAIVARGATLALDRSVLERAYDELDQAESFRADLQDLIDSESDRGYLLPQSPPPARTLAGAARAER